MDTLEILKILSIDKILKTGQFNVCSIDTLPIVRTKPAAVVVNLDPSYAPGSHWVAMYFNKNRCDYFDSYGRMPNQILFDYITTNSGNFNYNNKCIQAPLTSTCGQHCIFFLVWRSRGVPMSLIVQRLQAETSDEFVTKFINKLFKTTTSVYDENSTHQAV